MLLLILSVLTKSYAKIYNNERFNKRRIASSKIEENFLKYKSFCCPEYRNEVAVNINLRFEEELMWFLNKFIIKEKPILRNLEIGNAWKLLYFKDDNF